MTLAPFFAPTLSQVTAVQNALVFVSRQIIKEGDTSGPLSEADRAFSKGELDASQLISINPGPGYLFRYKTDPGGFARLIVKASEKMAYQYFSIVRDEQRSSPVDPSLIALHTAGLISVQ
jgi:hypothetical protein